MTDQVSENIYTAITTTKERVSSLPSTLQNGISSVTSTLQASLDRILPPSKRKSLKSDLTDFANNRPILASFLLSQVALSGLPLALFIILALTVVTSSLLTGVAVGVIGAMMFIGTILGLALLVLLPTLFVTTFFAVSIWMTAVAAYYVISWFRQERVPGVHRPLKDGLVDELGLRDSSFLDVSKKTGTADANGKAEPVDGERNGTAAMKGNTVQPFNGQQFNGSEDYVQGYGQITSPVQYGKNVTDVGAFDNNTPTNGLAYATDGSTVVPVQVFV